MINKLKVINGSAIYVKFLVKGGRIKVLQEFFVAFSWYYRCEPTSKSRSVYNVECTSIGAPYNEIIIIGDEHHHK